MNTTWTTHPGNIGSRHRYTDVGTGRVYGANSKKTALAEVNAWKVDLSTRELTSKKVQLNNVLDLTRTDVRKQLGISLNDITGKEYDVTHQIGSWAKKQGYDGILAPSARNPTGSNFIFGVLNMSGLEKYYAGDETWSRCVEIFSAHYLDDHARILSKKLNDHLDLAVVIYGKRGLNEALWWIEQEVPALEGMKPIDCLKDPELLKRLRECVMRMP